MKAEEMAERMVVRWGCLKAVMTAERWVDSMAVRKVWHWVCVKAETRAERWVFSKVAIAVEW